MEPEFARSATHTLPALRLGVLFTIAIGLAEFAGLIGLGFILGRLTGG